MTRLTTPQLKMLHVAKKVEDLGGEYGPSGGVERNIANRLVRMGLFERYNYGNCTHPKFRYSGYARLTPDGKRVVDQNPLPE